MEFSPRFMKDKKKYHIKDDLLKEKSFNKKLAVNMELINFYNLNSRSFWSKRALAPSDLITKTMLGYSQFHLLKILKAVKKPFKELNLDEFKGISL